MKKLHKKICSYVIALLVSFGFTSPSLAGSSDFSGIWIAGHAEMNVVAIQGTFTDTDGNSSRGTAGGFAPTAGYELGFNVPLGDTFFVTLGYANGGGESNNIAEADPAAGTNDGAVMLKATSPEWFYIAPSISIFDNSAVYFKYGEYHAGLKAKGNVVGSPNDIQGEMYGIGTTSIASNGLFFKTEAGAVQFDQFRISDIGGSGNTTDGGTNAIEGAPLMGYGHVSIGYKF
jgi:hypothetical protein